MDAGYWFADGVVLGIIASWVVTELSIRYAHKWWQEASRRRKASLERRQRKSMEKLEQLRFYLEELERGPDWIGHTTDKDKEG